MSLRCRRRKNYTERPPPRRSQKNQPLAAFEHQGLPFPPNLWSATKVLSATLTAVAAQQELQVTVLEFPSIEQVRWGCAGGLVKSPCVARGHYLPIGKAKNPRMPSSWLATPNPKIYFLHFTTPSSTPRNHSHSNPPVGVTTDTPLRGSGEDLRHEQVQVCGLCGWPLGRSRSHLDILRQTETERQRD